VADHVQAMTMALLNLQLKYHRKKHPVLYNIPKKRTFDCTENDETSHELNESKPKWQKLKQPSVMKYSILCLQSSCYPKHSNQSIKLSIGQY